MSSPKSTQKLFSFGYVDFFFGDDSRYKCICIKRKSIATATYWKLIIGLWTNRKEKFLSSNYYFIKEHANYARVLKKNGIKWTQGQLSDLLDDVKWRKKKRKCFAFEQKVGDERKCKLKSCLIQWSKFKYLIFLVGSSLASLEVPPLMYMRALNASKAIERRWKWVIKTNMRWLWQQKENSLICTWNQCTHIKCLPNVSAELLS